MNPKRKEMRKAQIPIHWWILAAAILLVMAILAVMAYNSAIELPFLN